MVAYIYSHNSTHDFHEMSLSTFASQWIHVIAIYANGRKKNIILSFSLVLFLDDVQD